MPFSCRHWGTTATSVVRFATVTIVWRLSSIITITERKGGEIKIIAFTYKDPVVNTLADTSKNRFYQVTFT